MLSLSESASRVPERRERFGTQRAAYWWGVLLLWCCGAPADPAPVAQEQTTAAMADTQFFANDFEATTQPSQVCTTQQADAKLLPGPVDIIIVVDNSPSMAEEVAAIEENINTSFADILRKSGSDYRVILLSRHRTQNNSSNGIESTSVCVSEPLSSLSQCPSQTPGASKRFFHYSLPVASRDSLRLILASLHAPDTVFGTTGTGWSQWLRSGAKKVFLEVTDDDADISAEHFIRELTTLAPEHFGADELDPQFVFHSIIGIREKETASDSYSPDEARSALRCRSDTALVRNSGLSYQMLSRLTSGLRFPICRADLFDTVFRHISQDVLRRSGVVCSLDIPPPPSNRTLELDNVELLYRQSSASDPMTLRRARVPADCGADAFEIVGGRVQLCAEACELLNAQEQPAELAVRFTCEPSYVIR